ncbi:hypothetical protein B0H13DRAFT_1925813 [Mycena leptocephala]|nr:hypothetical protein B0H13DRAFT_1925813 [Mycena leptocephala]
MYTEGSGVFEAIGGEISPMPPLSGSKNVPNSEVTAKREKINGEVEHRVMSQLLSLMDGLKARVPEEIACLDAVEEEDPVPEITRFRSLRGGDEVGALFGVDQDIRHYEIPRRACNNRVDLGTTSVPRGRERSSSATAANTEYWLHGGRRRR